MLNIFATQPQTYSPKLDYTGNVALEKDISFEKKTFFEMRSEVLFPNCKSLPNYKKSLEKAKKIEEEYKNKPSKIAKKTEKLIREMIVEVSTVATENIIVGMINNLIHKYLCSLADEPVKDVLVGTEKEVENSEKALIFIRKKLFETQDNFFIGMKKQYIRIKDIVVALQKEVGRINDDKAQEAVQEKMLKYFDEIRDEESNEVEKTGRESTKMYEYCMGSYEEQSFVTHVYLSTKSIEKLMKKPLLFEPKVKELINKLLKEMDKNLDEIDDFIDWRNNHSKKGLIRTIIDIDYKERTEKEFQDLANELEKLTDVKIRKMITAKKAAITREKNRIEKLKTPEGMIEDILKRHKKELKSSKEEIELYRNYFFNEKGEIDIKLELLKAEWEDCDFLIEKEKERMVRIWAEKEKLAS